MYFRDLASLLFVAAASGLVITDDALTEHEKTNILPAGWKRISDGSAQDTVQLQIYLKEAKSDLYDTAEAVSDPTSSMYGAHLTADQLRMSLPSFDGSRAAVMRWLNTFDANVLRSGTNSITFTLDLETANATLGAPFAWYQYQGRDAVLRTERYSVPRALQDDIDFIYPTVHFFKPIEERSLKVIQRRQHVPTGPANCSNSVCPAQLQKKYNINYTPKDNKSGSRIGVAGFLDQFPNITDVNSFLSQYGINKKAPKPPISVVSINNGSTKAPADRGDLTVEAELDLDYVTAFTGPLPVQFLSTGGRGPNVLQPGNKPSTDSENEPYLEFLQWLVAQSSPPQVISISYSDDEQSIPIKYARRVCDLFAQAAARGISVIGSSGDGGAAGTGHGDCIGPDGRHRLVPTFPSSCPWYTSVGATASYGGAASFSSGGFSNYFARPKWQDAAVTGYIKELNGSHHGFYNASGRGIPDVSLLGDDYLTLTGGFASTHDGTSASAPVFAAMIALLNDIRLRQGKPALGFLNPTLYAKNLTSAFRDVDDSVSQTTGCADNDFFEPGWESLKGWDAGTGLGEPDFEKLRAVLS